jgi:hypothetical protein
MLTNLNGLIYPILEAFSVIFERVKIKYRNNTNPIPSVVIGLGLLTRQERNSPAAPNIMFSKRVYRERIRNAFRLNGAFWTVFILIRPARAVTAFNSIT